MKTLKEMKEMKERSKEKPFGNCGCINAHHKGVILATIDTTLRTLSKNITEMKSDTRKTKKHEVLLANHIKGKMIIEKTRDELEKVPDCPD